MKFEDYFASIDIDPIQSTYENPKFIDPNPTNLEPLIKIFKELA